MESPSRLRASLARTRIEALALALGGALLLGPFLARPSRLPPPGGDWDYFLGQFEALRRTVLDAGEWPFWNPWNCGGTPLWANPQVGVVSLTSLLVLAFGAVAGVKLSVLAHLLLGLEGLRRLVRRTTDSGVALLLAAVLAFANGSFLGRLTSSGHYGAVVLGFYPWVLLAVLDLRRSAGAVLRLGLFLAAALFTSLHYFAVYLLLFLPILLLVEARRGDVRVVLARGALGIALGLLLAAPRVVPSALYVLEFPRSIEPVGYRVPQLLVALLSSRRDGLEPVENLREGSRLFAYTWGEFEAYVGALPLLGALLGILARPTAWAGLALLGLLVAMGPNTPVGGLFLALPVLEGLYFATRWMSPALLFLGIGGASGLPALARLVKNRAARAAAGLLLSAALLHTAILNSARGASAFPVDPRRLGEVSRADEGDAYVNLQAAPAVGEGLPLPAHLCVRMNFGVVAGYEPLLGYDRGRPNATRPTEGPVPRGEFWLVRPGGEEEVVPPDRLEWSPNRVAIRGVPLDGTKVRTNPNLGSSWLAGGRPVLPDARVVDLLARPAIAPDETGAVVLTVRPPGLRPGLLLFGAGVAIAIVSGRRRLSPKGE